MSWPLLLSQKALLPEAQSLALLQACFRLRPKRKDSSYPPPTSVSGQALPSRAGERQKGWNGRWPREKGPNSRCHRGEAAGGAAWPGVRSRPLACLSLSSPFTKFSHVPAACAAAADSPVGRSPRIVCAGSDDPRCPEGLGSLEPSIPSVRGRHAPEPSLAPGVHAAAQVLAVRLQAGPQFPYLKNKWTQPRDPQEPSSIIHSFIGYIY